MGWDIVENNKPTKEEEVFLEKFRKLGHDDQMLLFGIMDSFIDARKSANPARNGHKIRGFY